MILGIPLDKIQRPLMRTRANDHQKVKDLMESISWSQIGLQEPVNSLFFLSPLKLLKLGHSFYLVECLLIPVVDKTDNEI